MQHPISPLTLAEILDRAEQATPGPWIWSNDILRQRDGGRSVASAMTYKDEPIIDIGEEDEAYIAALDPSTIRAIIESHERLREAAEAGRRYDAGILGRAARGETDLLSEGGGVSTGDDLDSLYFDWQEKVVAALAAAPK